MHLDHTLTTFAPLTVSVNEADLFGSSEHVPCNVLRNANTLKGHISRRIKKGPDCHLNKSDLSETYKSPGVLVRAWHALCNMPVERNEMLAI
jgi:hypothetical protein